MRMNRHLICLLIDWLVDRLIETGSHCVALIVLEPTEIYLHVLPLLAIHHLFFKAI